MSAKPRFAVKHIITTARERVYKKPLGRCMVKPHGQLVQVSSTHCYASTPCLSTS